MAIRAVQVEMLLAGIVDASGEPLDSGKVYFYSAGTTTPKAIYTVVDKSTEATNPVTLDPDGRVTNPIYADGIYKVVITDSDDVVIETYDNLSFYTAFYGNEIYISDFANLAAALAYIGSDDRTLVFTPGDYTISANTVIPANVSVSVQPGAMIEVTGAYTLTFNGTFTAPPVHIFDNDALDGIIFGEPQEVHPEWWGAVGNGSTDDSSAITGAINSIVTNYGTVILRNLYAGTITIDGANAVSFKGITPGAGFITFNITDSTNIFITEIGIHDISISESTVVYLDKVSVGGTITVSNDSSSVLISGCLFSGTETAAINVDSSVSACTNINIIDCLNVGTYTYFLVTNANTKGINFSGLQNKVTATMYLAYLVSSYTVNIADISHGGDYALNFYAASCNDVTINNVSYGYLGTWTITGCSDILVSNIGTVNFAVANPDTINLVNCKGSLTVTGDDVYSTARDTVNISNCSFSASAIINSANYSTDVLNHSPRTNMAAFKGEYFLKTTDETQTTIASIDMTKFQKPAVFGVKATIVCGGADAAKYGFYDLKAVYTITSGSSVTMDKTYDLGENHKLDDGTAIDADFISSTTNIAVAVTGLAGTTLFWKASVEVYPVVWSTSW